MLSIGFVAANLGVSTSTLRKWEERYGHPKPLRSEGGSRWYRDSDLQALRQAKRLLDRGIRANRVFADFDKLLAEAEDASAIAGSQRPDCAAAAIDELMAPVRQHRLDELERQLRDRLAAHDVQAFIEGTAAPLMQAIGDGWSRGEIDVYQEHAVANLLAGMLGQQAAGNSAEHGPRVLLTTPSGEQHGIALEMVCAALAQAGAHCVNLGPNLPLSNTIDAAKAFHADVVGLSVSSVNAGRLVRRFIAELRAELADDVAIWVGGSGAASLPALPEGVRAFRDTIEPSVLIQEWIARHDSGSTGR
jgi:DNA-binding transcriptional MerR regulator/methylmalonyl-CoA mutase cobalamin-binding subunit